MAHTFTHYVVSKYIKTDYEIKHKMLVPQEIKSIVMEYSSTIMDCDLLSPKEDLDFLSLLRLLLSSFDPTDFTNYSEFELLFKASQHNFSANLFHKFCDNKGGLITIIATNHGNIFGACTSKSLTYNKSPGASWLGRGKCGHTWSNDKNAFLFVIRSKGEKIKKCPTFYMVQDAKYAICYDEEQGPGFGYDDIRIKDKCDKVPSIFITPSSYDIRDDNICGNDECLMKSPKCTMREFLVKDYYVFKIK